MSEYKIPVLGGRYEPITAAKQPIGSTITTNRGQSKRTRNRTPASPKVTAHGPNQDRIRRLWDNTSSHDGYVRVPKTPEEETQLIAIAQDAFMVGAGGFMGGIKGVLTAVGLLPAQTTTPVRKTFKKCTCAQAIRYAAAGRSVKCRWGEGGWVTLTRADGLGGGSWGPAWTFRVAVADKKVHSNKVDQPKKTAKRGVDRALTRKEAIDLLLHSTPVEARLPGGGWVTLSPKINDDISRWSSTWMFRRAAAKHKTTKYLTPEQAGALLRGGVRIQAKPARGAWISVLPEPDASVLHWGPCWKFREIKSDHKPASKN